jgi:hypothetical protein
VHFKALLYRLIPRLLSHISFCTLLGMRIYLGILPPGAGVLKVTQPLHSPPSKEHRCNANSHCRIPALDALWVSMGVPRTIYNPPLRLSLVTYARLYTGSTFTHYSAIGKRVCCACAVPALPSLENSMHKLSTWAFFN